MGSNCEYKKRMMMYLSLVELNSSVQVLFLAEWSRWLCEGRERHRERARAK